MINDGKFYAQYFIGWPALMAPGVWVGAAGYMNALYSALTVPPLFAIARRMGGTSAARVAILLFARIPHAHGRRRDRDVAPVVLDGARLDGLVLLPVAGAARAPGGRTRGSRSSSASRSSSGRRPPSEPGCRSSLRGSECDAPAAARERPCRRRVRRARRRAWRPSSSASTSRRTARLCLSSYASMQAYMREVNYPNVGWSARAPADGLGSFMLPNRHVGKALASYDRRADRLVFDLFGSAAGACCWSRWPASRGPHGSPGGAPSVSWRSISSWSTRASTRSARCTTTRCRCPCCCWPAPARPGSPIAGWTTRAAASLKACPAVGPRPRSSPSLVVVSLAGFVPVRLGTVKRIADNVNMPADAVRQARISNAVIFTAGLFTPQQCIAPTRHFAYFRPNNDPGAHQRHSLGEPPRLGSGPRIDAILSWPDRIPAAVGRLPRQTDSPVDGPRNA